MATAGDLCTLIIGDLGRGDLSISDTVLIDIKSAIRDYEAQRFFFNEREISVTFSATDTYALSLYATAGSVADIIEVDGIDLTVSTRTYELEELGAREVLHRQGNGDTSAPTFYAVYNQSVIIPSKPASAFVSVMYAHVKFAEIANFATSSVWTNDASELIRNAALKRISGRRYKDYEQSQAAAILERDALLALQRRTGALSGSTTTGYL